MREINSNSIQSKKQIGLSNHR